MTTNQHKRLTRKSIKLSDAMYRILIKVMSRGQ